MIKKLIISTFSALFSMSVLAATDTQIEKMELQSKKLELQIKKLELLKDIQIKENKLLELTRDDLINEIRMLYTKRIAEKVKDFWRYRGGKDNWGCDIRILQDVEGNVQSVNIQSCTVDNNAKEKSFKDAIERAVYEASPLPVAPDRRVFNREVLLRFRVD